MIKRNFHRRRSDGDCSSRVKDSRKSVSDRKIAREFLFGIRLEFNFFSFGSVIARELIFSFFRPFEFITIIIINYHHREVNFARRFERWRGEKREDSRRESQTLVARKRFPSYVIFQTCFRCFLRETLSNTTVPPPPRDSRRGPEIILERTMETDVEKHFSNIIARFTSHEVLEYP